MASWFEFPTFIFNHCFRFGFSVSHTTRAPRPGEVNGVHYHFSSRKEVRIRELCIIMLWANLFILKTLTVNQSWYLVFIDHGLMVPSQSKFEYVGVMTRILLRYLELPVKFVQ